MEPVSWQRARQRLPSLLPFAAIGSTCIVAGGLVAAVTAPLELAHGSWMAAYLVLALGVAQVALGAGQSLLARHPPSPAVVALEVAGWNLGGATVVAGTLTGTPVLTTVAGTVLLATLLLFIRAAARGSGEAREPGPGARAARWLYLAVLVILAVSVPVGMLLAWRRHG
ncbi:MAG TPA: hypothetical protein VF048_03235 [Gemmatimonadaceae bacterium]